MKKISLILLILSIMVSCELPDPGRRGYDFQPELKIGQVWLYVDSADPFRPVRYDTMRIIDIKGD